MIQYTRTKRLWSMSSQNWNYSPGILGPAPSTHSSGQKSTNKTPNHTGQTKFSKKVHWNKEGRQETGLRLILFSYWYVNEITMTVWGKSKKCRPRIICRRSLPTLWYYFQMEITYGGYKRKMNKEVTATNSTQDRKMLVMAQEDSDSSSCQRRHSKSQK